MTTPRKPLPLDLFETARRRTDGEHMSRAERQRAADLNGRDDRIAELVGDLRARAEVARWSLSLTEAGLIHHRTGLGVEMSGDHRPRVVGKLVG